MTNIPEVLSAKGWFDVDRKGLASLLDRRGREYAIYELIQNAWDEPGVTRVDVTVRDLTDEGWIHGYTRLIVKDDAPDGFKDLRHAYTMFARSTKRDDPEKRGRFNMGEKLVLALCQEARVTTTTGSVAFNLDGTRTAHPASKTGSGSVFDGVIAMNAKQRKAALAALNTLLPPENIVTTINGVPLPWRLPVKVFRKSLPTEKDDEMGVLRRTRRTTDVHVHRAGDGETGTFYEMGIPICPTGSRWHVNVAQKVPLTLDRENVTAEFLAELNVGVLNAMADEITTEDAAAGWVTQALGDPDASPEAVEAVITAKFGDKRVIFDPNDLEANKRALDQGYTIMHGSMLGKAQWSNVRSAGVALPAGKVTPSPQVFGDGPEVTTKHPDTPELKRFVHYAKWLHDHLVGGPLEVTLITDRSWDFVAAYGREGFSTRLWVSLRRGPSWDADTEPVNAVLIHEFAHATAGDHFGEAFHAACCKLGARLRNLPVYVAPAIATLGGPTGRSEPVSREAIQSATPGNDGAVGAVL